jgi:hypothetical protein
MKEATDFFREFQNSLIAGLYTSAIGRIERYDATTMSADVTLLPGGELLTSVPVSTLQTDDFIIRMPYKKGNYVMVSFSMRDIDGVMSGDDSESTGRMLDMNDAIVVCGLNAFTKPLPEQVTDTNDSGKQTAINSNDLIIASKDFKTRFIMPESGGFKIYTDDEAGGEIVAPMGLKIRANNPAGSGVQIVGKLESDTW